MPQTSRPDADVANDGWTPTPLYARLDEPEPDDGTFVASPCLPPARTFVIALAPLSLPIAGPNEDAARPHRLTVRLEGTPGATAVVALMDTIDGTDRAIAIRTFALAAAFEDCELVLTRAEAAAIGDYSALTVMVTAFGDSSSGSCPSSSGSAGHSSSSGSDSRPSASTSSFSASVAGSGGGSSSSSGSSVSASSASSSSSPSSGGSASGGSSGSQPSGSGSSSGSGSVTCYNTTTPLPAAIPDDDPAGVALVVPVSGRGAADALVSVRLLIAHTFDEDVRVRLTSPSGATRTLISYSRGSDPGYDVTLVDWAAESVAGPPTGGTVTGVFRPVDPLAGFAGDPNGVWTLVADDDAALDTGAVEALVLCFASPQPSGSSSSASASSSRSSSGGSGSGSSSGSGGGSSSSSGSSVSASSASSSSSPSSGGSASGGSSGSQPSGSGSSSGSGSVTCYNTTTPLPAAIPDDDPAGVALVVPVSGRGAADALVSVRLLIAHTFDEDVRVRLTSPSGATRTLISYSRGSDPGYDVTLVDWAAESVAGPPTGGTVTGVFRPVDPLAGFAGDPNGVWTLVADDDAALDTGAVEALVLCFASPQPSGSSSSASASSSRSSSGGSVSGSSSSSGGIVFSGCNHVYPQAIYGTWFAVGGTCDCFSGTFALAWDGVAGWVGTFSGCAAAVTVRVAVDSPTAPTLWAITFTSTGASYTFSGISPIPFMCGFLPGYKLTVGGDCDGLVELTFSE